MTVSTAPLNIPPGYDYAPSVSAFVDHIGPVFQKEVTPPSGPKEHWSALWIEAHHVNSWGFAHGALMTCLAEFAINAPAYTPGGPPTVIMQLSMSFVAPPKLGSLFEACGTLVKATRTLFFTEGRGVVGGELIFTATGIVKAIKG